MEKERREENNGDYDDHEEDEESLKASIASHPLYGLLVQTHLDCLKVGGNGDDLAEESDALVDYMKQLDIHKSTTSEEPELDHFMEAYCLALRNLKEAMEEPQRKTMTTITNMHHELKKLTTTNEARLDLPEPPTGFQRRPRRLRLHRHASGEGNPEMIEFPIPRRSI